MNDQPQVKIKPEKTREEKLYEAVKNLSRFKVENSWTPQAIIGSIKRTLEPDFPELYQEKEEKK